MVRIFLQHTAPFFAVSLPALFWWKMRGGMVQNLFCPRRRSPSQTEYIHRPIFFPLHTFHCYACGDSPPSRVPTDFSPFSSLSTSPQVERFCGHTHSPLFHIFSIFSSGEQSRFFLFAKPKISLSNKSTPPTTTTKYISFSFYLISAVFLCILRRHHLRPSQTVHTLPHTLRIVWAKTGFSIWEGFAEAFLFFFSGQKSRQNPLYSF